MNITKADIMKCRSMDLIQDVLTSEFPDHTVMDGELRFTVEPNQFLDVVEIPVSDDFSAHFKHIQHNTACLLLCKDDYSEMMFVMKEMSMAGNYIYRKYLVDIKQPRRSDLIRLQRLRVGSATSFLELFNTKDVVLEFYRKYKIILNKLQKNITGIKLAKDKQHYSQILLSRIMFLCFIQTRGFLSGDVNYLHTKFEEVDRNDKNFYRDFLIVLFFNILNTERDKRRDNLGTIPFLNGGLFKEHPIEKQNNIGIDNQIFKDLLNFLNRWLWHVDDTSTSASVNPEILGHIFETMIDDQHGKGAYYTPPDITQYICGHSILQYCVERVNDKFGTNYNTVYNITQNGEHTEYLYFDVVKPMKVLDSACGSGEFVLTAYKMLYELYDMIWATICERDTERIRAERKLFGNNTNYYFKRRIITENVYGVDIENGALEVCKLRLWLSLVADMDADNIEPLPNIDYNIMQGNSLAGYSTYTTTQQVSLDNPDKVSDILAEIEILKRAYKQERSTARAEALNKQITEKISVQKTRLDKVWKSDLGRKSGANIKNINPFHWILHFHDVITTGGFNVIVGNPPWISTAPSIIPETLKPVYDRKFETRNARDVYAYFIEMSLKMLRSKGRIGFIVALSSISTKTKLPLTKFLRDECSEIGISSYHDRPGKIFDGGNHARSAIILGQRGPGRCHIRTTHAQIWKSADRPTLLTSLKYVDNVDFQVGASSLYGEGIIPKFGNDIEKSIMAKFLAKDILATTTSSEFVLYYHDSMRYWVRVADHKFKKTHVHPVRLPNKKSLVVLKALLNSSLAYWFFNKTTNLKEISSHVKYLCANIKEFDARDITLLDGMTKKLDRHYKERYGGKEINTDTKYCKPIIDEIDDILAKHYGFTDEELDYIKNFQLEFRMG